MSQTTAYLGNISRQNKFLPISALQILASFCFCLLATRSLPGFEHTSLKLAKTVFLTGEGAKSSALDAWRKFHDPDLSQIVAAWPTLPEHVKSAILKMVKKATK
jgi:hypothetical protein